ncbi:MAG: phosphatase PAP2 family protein [Thermoanaerobaculia bacterium]|nr:phosphatase PAP2 family protein [Thermoanaerobaculia bacterium]
MVRAAKGRFGRSGRFLGSWKGWVPGLRLYEAIILANFAVVLWLVRKRALVGLDAARILRECLGFAIPVSFLLLGALGLRSLLAGRRAPIRAWIRLYAAFRPLSLLDFSRFVLSVSLTSFAYSWLKVTLPLLRPDVLFDDFLYRVETALHGGVNPGLFLQGLFPYAALWQGLDRWYATFIYTVLGGIAWFVSVLSSRERARFATGFSILWILGAWWYLAMPSLGPCFVLKDDYLDVRAAMPTQSAVMDGLYANYGRVRAFHRHAEGTDIYSYLGTAAMPSLHVAAQAFFALVARRRSRALFLLFTAATTLTMFGAVVSGWHYAIDVYAGLLLAWGCVRLGERFG